MEEQQTVVEFITTNYAALLTAALVFARVVFSLIPTEHPAQTVFGYLDQIITTLVGGDRRKEKQLPNDFNLE